MRMCSQNTHGIAACRRGCILTSDLGESRAVDLVHRPGGVVIALRLSFGFYTVHVVWVHFWWQWYFSESRLSRVWRRWTIPSNSGLCWRRYIRTWWHTLRILREKTGNKAVRVRWFVGRRPTAPDWFINALMFQNILRGAESSLRMCSSYTIFISSIKHVLTTF